MLIRARQGFSLQAVSKDTYLVTLDASLKAENRVSADDETRFPPAQEVTLLSSLADFCMAFWSLGRQATPPPPLLRWFPPDDGRGVVADDEDPPGCLFRTRSWVIMT